MEKLTQARRVMRDLFGDLSDLSDLSDNDPGPANDATSRAKTTPRKIVPKVGTTIQRGDAASRRRAIFLAEPIPPRPARRAQEKAKKRKTEQSWDFKRPGVVPANASTGKQTAVSATFRPTTIAREPTNAMLHPTMQSAASLARDRQRPGPVGAPAATTTTIQPGFKQPLGRLQRPGSFGVPAASTRPQPPPIAIVAATNITPATSVSSPPVTTGGDASSTTATVRNSAGATTIRVRLPTGKEVPVPFFPGSRHRKYRIRIEDEKWVIRFDREGHPTSCRKR